MNLDPIRSARARRMVLNHDTWPLNTSLPMKRLFNGGHGEFGVIRHPVDPYNITITTYDNPKTIIAQFPNLDALIDAGWTVD